MRGRSTEHALDLIRQLDDAVQRGRSRDDLDALFDTLVATCAALSEDHRESVRQAFHRCTNWAISDLWMEHQSPILKFRESGGLDNLRRALAHYSLRNGYRDAIVGISDLHVAAGQHGVDAAPLFPEIAAISSPDGIWALQKYMRPG